MGSRSGVRLRLSDSSSMGCLLVLATVLATCSRAQDSMEDPLTVTVALATDRLRTTAIIPSRVRSEGAIRIVGNETFSIMNSNPPNITSSFECEGMNCTLTLKSELDMPELETDPLQVTLEFSSRQSLVLTIRENLTSSCREYMVPRLFMSDAESYVFECDPLENASEVEQVIWRRFTLLEEVEMFLDGTQDFINRVILNNNSRLTIDQRMGEKAEDVVAYFVPSFRMRGGAQERVTAETLIFLGPEITTPHEEFSLEIVFGEEMNYTMIACEANTFPMASASWELMNTEFPDSVGLRDYVGFNNTIFLLDSGSTTVNMVRDAIVQMMDPTYEDDGLFTCTVDNGPNVVTQSVRLRIKSRLRPLWPALGIMGVAILVPLLMLGFFIAEKAIEAKKRHKYVEGSSNHSDGTRLSSTSSSSGGQNNNKGKKQAVKRLSSNKPLIDESTI